MHTYLCNEFFIFSCAQTLQLSVCAVYYLLSNKLKYNLHIVCIIYSRSTPTALRVNCLQINCYQIRWHIRHRRDCKVNTMHSAFKQDSQSLQRITDQQYTSRRVILTAFANKIAQCQAATRTLPHTPNQINVITIIGRYHVQVHKR